MNSRTCIVGVRERTIADNSKNTCMNNKNIQYREVHCICTFYSKQKLFPNKDILCIVRIGMLTFTFLLLLYCILYCFWHSFILIYHPWQYLIVILFYIKYFLSKSECSNTYEDFHTLLDVYIATTCFMKEWTGKAITSKTCEIMILL